MSKRAKLPNPETPDERAKRRHNHGELRTTSHAVFPVGKPCASIFVELAPGVLPDVVDGKDTWPAIEAALEGLPQIVSARVQVTNIDGAGNVLTAAELPKDLEMDVITTLDFRVEDEGTVAKFDAKANP